MAASPLGRTPGKAAPATDAVSVGALPAAGVALDRMTWSAQAPTDGYPITSAAARWGFSLHLGEQLVTGLAQRVVRVIAAPGEFRDLAKQDQVLAALGRDKLLERVLVAAAPGEGRELRRAQRVMPPRPCWRVRLLGHRAALLMRLAFRSCRTRPLMWRIRARRSGQYTEGLRKPVPLSYLWEITAPPAD